MDNACHPLHSTFTRLRSMFSGGMKLHDVASKFLPVLTCSLSLVSWIAGYQLCEPYAEFVFEFIDIFISNLYVCILFLCITCRIQTLIVNAEQNHDGTSFAIVFSCSFL